MLTKERITHTIFIFLNRLKENVLQFLILNIFFWKLNIIFHKIFKKILLLQISISQQLFHKFYIFSKANRLLRITNLDPNMNKESVSVSESHSGVVLLI